LHRELFGDLPASVPVSKPLTATATSLSEYNTSEFSICRGIYPPLPLVIEHSGTDAIMIWADGESMSV